MINIEVLKQKKYGYIKDARSITNKAETEKRSLTTDEKDDIDRLIKNSHDLENQIELEERKQKLDMSATGQRIITSQSEGKCRNLNLKEEDRSLLRYLRGGPGNLDSNERRALVEDGTGYYLVTEAIETDLQRSVAELVPIRQLASKKTLTNSDRLLVRDIEEVQVGWGKLETGSLITESTPTPSSDTKYVEDLYGLVKIGEDELMDSDENLAAFVADSFSRKVAEAESLGFSKGGGHTSSQPEGITLNTTLLAAAKTTAAAGSVTINDFMQCIYEVPASHRKGSAWIVNSLTEFELRKLRWDGGGGAGTGGYLWQPSLIQGAPNTFLGFPIYNDENLDTLNDVEGILGIFGNFQVGYRIIDRMGITIQRLNEIYSEEGLVGFKVHFRVGGYLRRPSNKALVLLKEHS